MRAGGQGSGPLRPARPAYPGIGAEHKREISVRPLLTNGFYWYLDSEIKEVGPVGLLGRKRLIVG